MREYETIYLLKADLSQDKLSDLKTKFNQSISDTAGRVIAESDWGKRKLAYDVDKQKYAYYIYLRYAAQGESVSRLERLLKLEDTVLKFLTVKLAEQFDEASQANQAKTALEAPEEVIYERPSPAPRRSYRSYDDRPRRGGPREGREERFSDRPKPESGSAQGNPPEKGQD